MNLLIVDDIPINLKLLRAARNSNPGKVIPFDEKAGFNNARFIADQPDLILMDIQLPGMDGLAAAALLKQDPATAANPFHRTP